MSFKFNPFSSTFDIVGGGGSGGIAIGDPISGILTDNPILFADSSDQLATSQNFMFDAVAKTFTVGGDTLDVISQFSGATILTDDANILFYAGVDQGHVTVNPAAGSGVIFEVLDSASSFLLYSNSTNRYINFGTNTDLGSTVGFVAVETSDNTICVRQLTGQTGRLTSWQAVGTNQLIGINVSGEMEFGPTSSGVKVSGFSAGYISFKGYGNTNNEELQFDFESIANTVSVVTTTGVTTFAFNSIDVTVPDEAYGAGWNGSLEVPTKNALYDKIETLSSSGLSHPEVMARISIGI